MKKWLITSLIFIFVLTGCVLPSKEKKLGALDTITFDASSTSNTLNSTSISWSHTVAANANTILIVGVAANDDTIVSDCYVSTVTYNGDALTQIRRDVYGSSFVSELWYRVEPDEGGSYTITVTFATWCDRKVVGAMSFYNVNQTTPIDDDNGATGLGTDVGVSLTASGSGRMMVDNVCADSDFNDTLAPDTGQSERWETRVAFTFMGAGSYEAGEESPGWTISDSSQEWIHSAILLIPSGEEAPPADTCTPPASGNWTVNLGDNCYVKTNTFVPGKLILIDNKGSGCLNIIDGAFLAVTGWESTSTRDVICLESDDGSALKIWNPT